MSEFRAVLFDLGGVILRSPIHEIGRFEQAQGLPSGLVNRHVHEQGGTGAWARHERGEIDFGTFLADFRHEFEVRGFEVDTAALMSLIDGSITPRPEMLDLVEELGRHGFLRAAITNNWHPFTDPEFVGRFDVFVESVVEGVRKPEPEIYRRCVERLGVGPSQCVMLDDLGPNLKPAREMGMETVKVVEPTQAIADLRAVLGI